jgi:hypothetical protein
MAGQYRFKDSNGNIVAQISASVGGVISFSGSQIDFSQANTISLGEVQLAGTASNALLLDGFDSQAFAFTSSIHPFTASIAGTNTFTSSASTRLDSIETITASNVSRLNSLEIKTGSLATTGSNTFIGTQTITGSLFISSDLVVQGSSSLQNITASAVSIGTNIVNLNTANPAIRYAGLVIGDSGSIGGSGSFLYDSVQDEMLFIHRGDSSVVTSSVTLMGPETYDNLGNEIYLTNNRLPKGTGKEHLVDSCITDSGTLVTINSATQINSSITGCGAISTSGTGTNASIRINNTTSSTGKDWHSYSLNNGNFGLYNNTDGNYAYQITPSGNLGISGNVTINKVNADARLLICQSSSSSPYTATIELSSQGVGTYGATIQYDAAPENLTIENYGRSASGLSRGDIRFRTKVNNTTPTDVLALNGFAGIATITGEGIFINRPATSSGEPYIFWQKDGVTRGAIYGGNNAAGLRYFGVSNCFEGVVCAPQFTGGFVCAVGGLNVRGASTTWSTLNIFPDNPGGSGAQCNTVLAASITGCSGWGPQLRFSGGTGGFIDIGQNSSGGFVVETSDNPRLNIAQNGNSTFSCLVTTDSLAITTNVLHGIKTFNSGATSSYVINLPAEFPNALLTGGNVWGVIGKALFFSGGQAEVRDFYIARTSGGSWSSANYGPQVVTSGGILQSVTGSGTCITINMNAGSYVTVEITAMVR